MNRIATALVALLPAVLWAWCVVDAQTRGVPAGWDTYEWVLVGGVSLATVMVAGLGLAHALRRR